MAYYRFAFQGLKVSNFNWTSAIVGLFLFFLVRHILEMSFNNSASARVHLAFWSRTSSKVKSASSAKDSRWVTWKKTRKRLSKVCFHEHAFSQYNRSFLCIKILRLCTQLTKAITKSHLEIVCVQIVLGSDNLWWLNKSELIKKTS